MAIAERSHPFPFRTRKLSSPAPMVLHGRLCGRVGRRRILTSTLLGSRSRGFFYYRTPRTLNLAPFTAKSREVPPAPIANTEVIRHRRAPETGESASLSAPPHTPVWRLCLCLASSPVSNPGRLRSALQRRWYCTATVWESRSPPNSYTNPLGLKLKRVFLLRPALFSSIPI